MVMVRVMQDSGFTFITREKLYECSCKFITDDPENSYTMRFLLLINEV